jgi:hypothetical protein
MQKDKIKIQLDVVADAYNYSTQEAEVERS